MEIVITPRDKCDKIVEEFMRDHGLHHVIAFSGGADSKLEGVDKDDELQKLYKKYFGAFEKRVISEALHHFQGHRIAILTGGTGGGGIPETATRTAHALGFKTIGVYPAAGKKHALGDVLDLALCVESGYGKSRWGDESPIYAKLLDGSIVFGGSAGTLIECAHILKINDAIIKKNEGPPKLIVPIHRTGGVANGLHFLWAKPDVRSRSLPDHYVFTGQEAARLLIKHLSLYDYYDHSLAHTSLAENGQ